MKTIRIQPDMAQDLSMPWPFYIQENGGVAQQQTWKGDPTALIGFQNDIDVQRVNLLFEDWWSHPESAVGKYAVFVDQNGKFWVHKRAIIEVSTTEISPHEEL